MKYMVCTYYFSIFVLNNHLTDKVKPIHSLDCSMPMTASEKTRQNRKNRMELNKLKKSMSKLIQIKNILNQTNV